MRYGNFKLAFSRALTESGLNPTTGLTERLNLGNLDREVEVLIEPFGGQDAEPFYVTASITWRCMRVHPRPPAAMQAVEMSHES